MMYRNAIKRLMDFSVSAFAMPILVPLIAAVAIGINIDEIPQLINVLLGDMSLIGPRPSLTTTPYSQYNDIRKKRVSVRPGVTGYSQAYFRNSITQEEKFKYDCDYVDNITFTGDVKILKRTILSVLKRDNIYVKQ